MISIGLDLSINSTGVCVYDDEAHTSEYFIVAGKMTKKAQIAQCDFVNRMIINKLSCDSKEEYHVKEAVKTNNIYNIVCSIRSIVEKYNPHVVSVEGVAFNASGDVIGLAGLNYMVRMMLKELNINNIYIVSPTTLKKYATGNGQATKDVMISAWNNMDKKTLSIPTCIKVDDIADAYFLARYGASLIIK